MLATLQADGDDHDLSPAVAAAAHRSILERLDDLDIAPTLAILPT